MQGSDNGHEYCYNHLALSEATLPKREAKHKNKVYVNF